MEHGLLWSRGIFIKSGHVVFLSIIQMFKIHFYPVAFINVSECLPVSDTLGGVFSGSAFARA